VKKNNKTAFKQSPPGPIPEDWVEYRLFDLAEWINGLAFRDISFSDDGIPVIKINELKNGLTSQTRYTKDQFDNIYHLVEGDMLFSWSGQPESSIDAFWFDLPEGWLNQHVFKVIPKSCIDSKYLYYLIKHFKPIFIGIAKDKQTTGLGHVTIKDLKRLNTYLPPLPEQHRIAEILSSLDDKIELNRKINKTLESIAQAIFKRWFVDFEFPSEKGKPYKSSGGKMVESELGMIPEGWISK